MDHAKLFGVLVLGGAMLGLGCGSSAPGPLDAASDDDAVSPAGDGGARADAAAVIADDTGSTGDSGLEECGFCPNVECCETGPDGTPRERPGLVCCWSTSC